MLVALSLGELFRHGVEQALPLGALASFGVKGLASDEQVDGVGLVGTLGTLLERQGEDTGVVTEPPVVCLVTGKPGAVDTRLLAGTEADDGSVESVADRVGLSVLEHKGGDDQVGNSLGRELETSSVEKSSAINTHLLVLGHNVGEQRLVNLGIVAALLHRDTVDLTGLDVGRSVVGVHLEHAVLATLLLAKDLERLGLVSGGDDTVGHFAGDDPGGRGVHGVRESNKVTKGRHAVGTCGD